MSAHDLDMDAVHAAIDLAGRSGAFDVEFGHDGDVEDDSLAIADVTWWAAARYRGARIIVDRRAGPVEALEALARRVLKDATCRRCGRKVTLAAGADPRRCKWTRRGDRWEATCGLEIDRSIPVPTNARPGAR